MGKQETSSAHVVNLVTLQLSSPTGAWEPLAGNPCLGTLAWEPVPGNLAWNLLGTLPGNPFLKTFLLVTSSWEPLLGNLFLVTLPENLAGNLFLGTLLGNLFLGTLLGNLLLGTLAEPVLGSLLETLLGNLLLGTLLGNLAWESLPGNPIPNLALCGFGCSEGFSWKRKPFPGTRFPNLAPCGSGCSDLLRNLYFIMAEDPKLTLLGNHGVTMIHIIQYIVRASSPIYANMTCAATANHSNHPHHGWSPTPHLAAAICCNWRH